nr:RsmF rRNA methyltransferase first C-terminal domain-containing protein [Maliibacterium massiliense]
MTRLPEAFAARMQALLGEEYPAFLQSYAHQACRGLRVNPLKVAREAFLARSPWPLAPVFWAKNGFYYPQQARPGRHPYHEAGLYYLQEPSAMAVGAYVGARPGERVLDLCAAPGGKTTQIAADMGGEGLLVANEIHPARAKILSQNVERLGVRNALVTNETPQRLQAWFPAYFDRILVDAPCSGEGMFRRDEAARDQWCVQHVAMCAARQQEILTCAAHMLRPGGRLVYATCTFAPEENEGTISAFVRRTPGFTIEQVARPACFDGGHAAWVSAPTPGIAHAMRLWPHRLEGEGHFIAVLRKEAGCAPPRQASLRPRAPACDRQSAALAEAFARENLRIPLAGLYLAFGAQLYQPPEGLPSLAQHKVLRAGLALGVCRKDRFAPAHALALALTPGQVQRSVSFAADDARLAAYLHGETISVPQAQQGWTLVCVDGFSIGWGKVSGGVLKNHYPKGLRAQW